MYELQGVCMSCRGYSRCGMKRTRRTRGMSRDARNAMQNVRHGMEGFLDCHELQSRCKA